MYKRYEKYKDSEIEWIGEIPEHWSVNKLKRLALIVTGNTPPKVDDDNYSDEGIQWIKPDNIIDGGKVTSSKERLSAIGLSKARLIPPGSALVSCIGTVGRIGINLESVTTNQQINSIIFNMKEVWNNNYGYFCLVVSKKELEKYANKVVVPILNKDNQGNIFFPLPYYTEQQEISLFLNKKTSDIDSLIADKEKLIKKLEEYKQSLITEAVTKGLNPDVKMKDSGVEWIGDIPEHWEVKRIKYLFRIRNERNQKSKNEVQLLTLYSAFGVRREEEVTDKTGNIVRTVEDYKIVYPDDIVVNIILAWMGSIGMSKYHGVISPAYDIYKPLDETFSQFYNYYFRTYGFSGDCFKNGRGIMLMRWRTYSDEFRSIAVCIPPYKDQYKIAEHLDTRMAEIDNLIDDNKSHINKLNSYRQSLIFEAVTGKIDVRDYQFERSEQFA